MKSSDKETLLQAFNHLNDSGVETITSVELELLGINKKLLRELSPCKNSDGDFLVKKAIEFLSIPDITVAAVKAEENRKENESLVPSMFRGFQKFGDFKKIVKVLESKMFFPIMVTGPSGNGKTLMIEQACASCNVPLIRFQMSKDVDAEELIGSLRIIDGDTVFQKGPVLEAMERGIPILLDECDRASNSIIALQSVLEGNGVLIPKTNEVIYPKAGFNVFATANTKGHGDETGYYTASIALDDAFLERFPILICQQFPDSSTEEKILKEHFLKITNHEKVPEGVSLIINKLITWANSTRELFATGGIEHQISTRRLVHIISAFVIFQNTIEEAVEYAVARFPEVDAKALVKAFKSH